MIGVHYAAPLLFCAARGSMNNARYLFTSCATPSEAGREASLLTAA